MHLCLHITYPIAARNGNNRMASMARTTKSTSRLQFIYEHVGRLYKPAYIIFEISIQHKVSNPNDVILL